MRISLKYKLMLVFLLVVVTGMSSYFYLTRETFLQDKKLFVLDWSLSTLKASTAEVRFELKTRLDELQIALPRLFSAGIGARIDDKSLLVGNGGNLQGELLSVTFYQKVGDSISEIQTHLNSSLLTGLGLLPQNLNQLSPLDLVSIGKKASDNQGLFLVNRSTKLSTGTKSVDLPILSLVISGNKLGSDSNENFVVANLLQRFLQKSINQSELAELFLVSKDGRLISHPNTANLITFSKKPISHPVVGRINTSSLPKESFEASIEGQDYLINFSPTGIGSVFAVSQIKRSDAFQALQTLTKQSLNMGLLILSLALIGSVVFSAQLTRNIKKLEVAAKTIGEGNLEVKTNIRSGDEVEKVATTFEWMTKKITSLLKETAEKARMQEELATASLIQNTILTPPALSTAKDLVVPYYRSASECGGDLWDAFVRNGKLTVLLGDATGHGAPAAIVTAVVKSCVSTLNELLTQQVLSPADLLHHINKIVHEACKGQLLMTMSIAQLDLESGELVLSNAGHEAPFRISSKTASDTSGTKKKKAESLFVQGERLGFQATSEYTNLSMQLQPGDTVLVYSDGLTEAHNANQEIWGERAVKKTFAALSEVSLEEIRDGLLRKLESFTEGTAQPDDITFVLFGWKKPQNNKKSMNKVAA